MVDATVLTPAAPFTQHWKKTTTKGKQVSMGEMMP